MTRVALITGAGRGIGRAAALELARAGFDCGLMARSASQLGAVADEILALGARAAVFPGSVRESAAAEAAVRGCADQLGSLDVLVNNAGVFRTAPLLETSDELWREVLGTNLDGAFYMARAASRRMIEQGRGGTLVQVASVAARQGFAGSSAYCASKFGLLGLTEVLREELRPHRIRVIAVLPGQVDTDAWDQSGLDLESIGIDRARMMRAADVGLAIAQAVAARSAVPQEIVLQPGESA